MKHLSYIFTIFLALFYLGCSKEKAPLRLPAVIGSGMVLQQQTEAPIWGWTSPGKTVNITASWDSLTISAKADNNGKWLGKVKTPQAGGPFEITITGDSTIVLTDILIGEVWVCSGQSNMEMSVSASNNGKQEIESANYPQIRLFKVEHAIAFSPKDDCIGQWQICSPQTVGDFSGSAYFFGKFLQQNLNVPVGLIMTSWGGTPSESWTSAATLKTIPDFSDVVQQIEKQSPDFQNAQRKADSIQAENRIKLDPDNSSNLGIKENWMSPDFDDSSWDTLTCPIEWSKSTFGMHEGVAWFRINIEIPANWANRELTLDLGPVDEMDVTWFDGQKIGEHRQISDWQKDRSYSIKPEWVNAGKATIVCRVVNTYREGGFFGKPEQMRIYPSKTNPVKGISLSGTWHCNKSYTIAKTPIEANPNTPTTLYNAMIAPLVPFGIAGAIWYQGEANVGRALQYREIFPAMITDWRTNWNQGDFHFGFVQIAPFKYGKEPEAAELREAQFLTLAKVINTGMAVTMDIGNPDDIHPTNKQDVGKRLALWALASKYGKSDLVYSGPLYKSMAIESDKIRLTFDHTGSGLMVKGDKLTHFEIAGEDKVFVEAKAVIDGTTVVVSNPKVKNPVAVRYGWQNACVPNLFNKEGLPASSFRTDF